MKTSVFLTIALLISIIAFPQQPKDKGIITAPKSGYYQKVIMKDVKAFDDSVAPAKKRDFRFTEDFTGMDFPDKISLCQQEWRFPPVSQGSTNTCWCFSMISFLESEVKRLSNQEIKLSEMYIVYWEYVEKVRRFIQERGNSNFDEGSENNAVLREAGWYGLVPESAYTGLEPGRKFHAQDKMHKEMKAFLESAKASNNWNVENAIETAKSIMDHYIGKPPVSFTWNGKTYSPKEFLSDVLKLKLDDYVDIMSLMQQPYWQKCEYEVPDNWWHSKEYYNVPLDDFMKALKNAILNHYTTTIGGDVSEPGFNRDAQVAIIPSFDIPEAYIDENARQLRFTNGSTTDDHGMHMVGFCEKNGHDWYLIKDSGSGSRNNDENAPEFGYYFFRSDFVKLKMMSFTVHKDAVKDLLKRFETK
jgi:bleomycin hydrolase